MKKTTIKPLRRTAAYLLTAALLTTGIPGANVPRASAAAPVKLEKKSTTLTIKRTDKKSTYGKAQINVQYLDGIKIKKIKYASKNKKIATVSSTGTVKAKKKGSTKITVSVRYQSGKKTRTKKLTYQVKVVLKDLRKKAKATKNPVAKVTEKPAAKPTAKPTNSPKATSTPNPANPTNAPQGTLQPATKKNEEDVAALKKIIAEQKALGAEITEEDINTHSYLYERNRYIDIEEEDDYSFYYYLWDNDGSLIGISWEYCVLSGKISVAEFPKLEYLNCGNNKLTSLNVSSNQNLDELICSSNNLVSLDISNNTVLKILECYDNQLTSLDLSKNIVLTELLCDNNQLTSLDVSKNKTLKYLQCTENQMTQLNISGNDMLTNLYCSINNLSSLDIRSNTALVTLDCSQNQITALDTSQNKDLLNLLCSANQINSLNLSNNTKLMGLHCTHNQLTALDVTKNTNLIDLSCDDFVTVTGYIKNNP